MRGCGGNACSQNGAYNRVFLPRRGCPPSISYCRRNKRETRNGGPFVLRSVCRNVDESFQISFAESERQMLRVNLPPPPLPSGMTLRFRRRQNRRQEAHFASYAWWRLFVSFSSFFFYTFCIPSPSHSVLERWMGEGECYRRS